MIVFFHNDYIGPMSVGAARISVTHTEGGLYQGGRLGGKGLGGGGGGEGAWTPAECQDNPHCSIVSGLPGVAGRRKS